MFGLHWPGLHSLLSVFWGSACMGMSECGLLLVLPCLPGCTHVIGQDSLIIPGSVQRRAMFLLFLACVGLCAGYKGALRICQGLVGQGLGSGVLHGLQLDSEGPQGSFVVPCIQGLLAWLVMCQQYFHHLCCTYRLLQIRVAAVAAVVTWYPSRISEQEEQYSICSCLFLP